MIKSTLNKFLMTIIFIFVAGCNTRPDLNAQKTQEMTRALETARAGIVVSLPTERPTSSCSPDQIRTIKSQLDEITGKNITPSPQPGNQNSGLTTELRISIVNNCKNVVNKIDSLAIPDCMKPAVNHLKNDYQLIIDVYSLENKSTGAENFQKLMLAGQEMKLYEDEINKVVTQ